MSDFRLRDDAYSEPYDRPQHCALCGAEMDGYPEAHEVTCPHHPDYRADLDELDEVDALVPVRHKDVA